jgi:predicted ATP-binding protein involved in virulence
MNRRSVIAPLRFVKIQNFRGVRDLTLLLDPKVTVLFGVNASGKTSILDAIAIGLGAIPARMPKALGRDFAKSGDVRVPWRDRADFDEKNGVERPFTRVEVAAANELRWDVSRLRSVQDRPNIPAAVGTKDLNGVLDPLVKQVLERRGAGRDEPTELSIPLVAAYGTERAVVDVPLRERDFQREFQPFAGLDQSLRAITRFKTVFEWFRLMEDEERRERQRRQNFNYLLPELDWVRRAVDRAQLRCKNPRVETRPIRMLIDFDHGAGATEPLDINSLSDGYRTHFSLVVDVARRMVQLNPSDDLDHPSCGTNSEAVILIDEIDLHLDPTWQATVVQGLQSAFPNAQFILTTHSEQVIGSVGAASVRKLVAGDGEVIVEGVPFAQGATGERILIDLMGAQERVAGPVTEKLAQYLELIGQGKGREPSALALRAELDRDLPNDPQLHQADLEMQRRDLMAKIGVQGI